LFNDISIKQIIDVYAEFSRQQVYTGYHTFCLVETLCFWTSFSYFLILSEPLTIHEVSQRDRLAKLTKRIQSGDSPNTEMDAKVGS
jgi:ribonucleotide reductase beta subunit family protein with ferritin-like domain